MNDTKHNVTVYDSVPATASIAVAQVEAYLRRTRWTRRRMFADDWSEWWSFGEEHCVEVPPSDDFRSRTAQRLVECIADCEKRQPSAVLADIAREHAS